MKAGRIVWVVGAAFAAAGCGGASRRPPSAAADPDGEWTLTQVVEDDESTHGPPPAMTIRYVVDTSAGTLRNEWYLEDATVPQERTTFRFEVTPTGTWWIEDAGPDDRSIEFSVDCTASTLTLTRVAYRGPPCEVPPAVASIEGIQASPGPTTIPPPRKFILSR